MQYEPYENLLVDVPEEYAGGCIDKLSQRKAEMLEMSVFYHADKKECDFVVREGMRIMNAYQVTIVMNDEKTRKREIEGLMEAMNAYGLAEGYILTMEEKEELEIDGKQVHVLPTWEWMLREK
jgi:predicted AAA+ superfamily ATPase